MKSILQWALVAVLGVAAFMLGAQYRYQQDQVSAAVAALEPQPALTLTPAPTPTAIAVAAPTGVPTPNAQELQSQLDAAWASHDWSLALDILDRLERVAPNAMDFQDKRYAAHIFNGQQYQSRANVQASAQEFSAAEAIAPERNEAHEALRALSQSPTPVPTSSPRATLNDYFARVETDMTSAGIFLSQVGDGSRQAAANPARLVDQEWRSHMSTALAGMKIAGQHMQSYGAVPAEATSLNGEIATIGNDLIYIADTTAQGIDYLDIEAFDLAIQRMNAMAGRTNVASSHAAALRAKYGI